MKIENRKNVKLNKIKQRKFVLSEKKLQEARELKLKLKRFIKKEKKLLITKKKYIERKFNEDTDYNKLLKLKRVEIEMEKEYDQFKNKMENKLEEIKVKEKDYLEKFQKVMQNNKDKELRVFDKLENLNKDNLEKCRILDYSIEKKKREILESETLINKIK